MTMAVARQTNQHPRCGNKRYTRDRKMRTQTQTHFAPLPVSYYPLKHGVCELDPDLTKHGVVLSFGTHWPRRECVVLDNIYFRCLECPSYIQVKDTGVAWHLFSTGQVWQPYLQRQSSISPEQIFKLCMIKPLLVLFQFRIWKRT